MPIFMAFIKTIQWYKDRTYAGLKEQTISGRNILFCVRYPESKVVSSILKVKHVAVPRAHHVTSALVVLDLSGKKGSTWNSLEFDSVLLQTN